ncbi:hypothetical protein PV04_09913 [Phialophora macrospora]|uniref:F-box domain-containing protein n=1 Tax=Phialophora macrospora TaxID=1851006 RepID=A0A0D2FSM1_9EURO|nr:hypothetical protein PV04_09913 [Phialophora macrospora]
MPVGLSHINHAPRSNPLVQNTMTLLSLPPEILSIICQYVVLADLGPERRLHPCTNCRYLSKGARRREHACPPLLLCCRHLHGISSHVLYKNVTIVAGLDYHSQPYYFRSYPTPERDKDIFSVLTARTSVLPRIRNLELLVSRTIHYHPRSHVGFEDMVFRSNWEDLPTVVASFLSKLPNLDALSYTVGVGALPNEALCIWPHAATTTGQIHRFILDEQVFENTSTWPVPLSYYSSLLVSPTPLHGLEAAVTRLRLWLTAARIMDLKQISLVMSGKCAFGSVVPEHMADPWRQFWRIHHPFAQIILQMPQLAVLDVYVPEGASPNNRSEEPPLDKAMAERLTRALEIIFPHVRTVRLWRARSENVTSGDFTVF